MTNPELAGGAPSTPQQASTLLGEVGELTTLQGRNHGDQNTFETDVAEMPTEVSQHLPDPDTLSGEVKDTAYIVQTFDHATGQPKRDGVVGTVTFTRTEKPDKDLSYAAHANYHITTDNGGETYGLERHVTNTEHGPHRVGRAALDPAALLDELTALRDRVEESRPVEQAMGMFTVTQTEARQVIDFTKDLNGEGQ